MPAEKPITEQPSRMRIVRRRLREKVQYGKARFKALFLAKCREPKIAPVWRGWGEKSGVRLRCFVSETAPGGMVKAHRIIAGTALENLQPRETTGCRGGIGGRRGTLKLGSDGKVSIYVPEQYYATDIGRDLLTAAERVGKTLALKELNANIMRNRMAAKAIFEKSGWEKYSESKVSASYRKAL